MTAPLAGVRVIEMGQLIAVPWATKMLADMGAQVIRLESCDRLESYRTDALFQNSVDGEFWNRGGNFYEHNRNKLGITLDLSQPEGTGYPEGPHIYRRYFRGKLHSPGSQEFRSGTSQLAGDQTGHHHGVLDRLRVHRALG